MLTELKAQADSLWEAKRHSEECAVRRRIVRLTAERFGETGWDYASALGYYGRALVEAGELTAARSVRGKELQVLLDMDGIDPRATAAVREHLAIVEEKLGNARVADLLLDEALLERKKVKSGDPEEQLRTAGLLHRMGAVKLQLGDYRHGERCLRMASAIYEAWPERRSTEARLDAHLRLACALLAQDAIAEASELLRDAVEEATTSLDEGSMVRQNLLRARNQVEFLREGR